MPATNLVGVDVGGTFTDLILMDEALAPTGLGSLSTAVGEAEVEYFLEVLNACIHKGGSA